MFFDIFECGWSARCPYGKLASENALHKIMMLATVKTLGNSLAPPQLFHGLNAPPLPLR